MTPFGLEQKILRVSPRRCSSKFVPRKFCAAPPLEGKGPSGTPFFAPLEGRGPKGAPFVATPNLRWRQMHRKEPLRRNQNTGVRLVYYRPGEGKRRQTSAGGAGELGRHQTSAGGAVIFYVLGCDRCCGAAPPLEGCGAAPPLEGTYHSIGPEPAESTVSLRRGAFPVWSLCLSRCFRRKI